MKDYNLQCVMCDLSHFSKVYLVPLGDFHIGYPGVEFDKIKGYVEWIRNRDNTRVILMGDLMDCATKTSATELFDSLTTPDQAYSRVREILMPIRNKIMMVVRGNHEESIYRMAGTDFMARLAYDLGDLPYKPDGGMVGMRLATDERHKLMCYVYATHGWGGARTIGAKVKKAQDLMLVANADIYLLAHDHTANINRGNILEPPGSGAGISFKRPSYVTIGRRLFINTGGFITYGGYVQRKGLTPQDCGTPRIRIEVKQTNLRRYLDLHASL